MESCGLPTYNGRGLICPLITGRGPTLQKKENLWDFSRKKYHQKASWLKWEGGPLRTESPLTLTSILLDQKKEQTSLNEKRSCENKPKIHEKPDWLRDFTKNLEKANECEYYTLSSWVSFGKILTWGRKRASQVPQKTFFAGLKARRRLKANSVRSTETKWGPFSQAAYPP